MPTSRRQDIRAFFIDYFNTVEYQTTIEECVNAYIKSRKLGKRHMLKEGESKTSKTTSTKERTRLRDQVTQELGNMKQMGLIGRARYGVYVKKLDPQFPTSHNRLI